MSQIYNKIWLIFKYLTFNYIPQTGAEIFCRLCCFAGFFCVAGFAMLQCCCDARLLAVLLCMLLLRCFGVLRCFGAAMLAFSALHWFCVACFFCVASTAAALFAAADWHYVEWYFVFGQLHHFGDFAVGKGAYCAGA